MPGLSGAEVCAELAERAVRTGVLLYTAEVDHETIRAGLEAGARGVVLKAGPGDDLPRAVRAVAGGATYIEPTLAGALVGGGRKLGVLTNREREVLQLIANGITTHGVAHELGLSPNTVRSYVESATSKLGARGRSHAVAEAFRRQLIV
jgi:two-component system response regulator DesR